MKENEDFCFTRDIKIQTSSDRRVDFCESFLSVTGSKKDEKSKLTLGIPAPRLVAL